MFSISLWTPSAQGNRRTGVQNSPYLKQQNSPTTLKSKPDQQNHKKQTKSLNIDKAIFLTLVGVSLLFLANGVRRFVNKVKTEVQRREKEEQLLIQTLHSNLEEIFDKPFTETEMKQFILTYDKLLNIKDDAEFLQKAFQQVKKDFGFEHLDVSLYIEEDESKLLRKGEKEEVQIGGHWDLSKKIIMVAKPKQDVSHARILNVLVHELNHLRQYIYIGRAELSSKGVVERHKTALISLVKKHHPEWDTISDKKQQFILTEAATQWIDGIKKHTKALQVSTFPKIKEGTPDYQKVEQYLNGAMSYVQIEDDEKAYRNNPVEVESYKLGDNMEKVIIHWEFLKHKYGIQPEVPKK